MVPVGEKLVILVANAFLFKKKNMNSKKLEQSLAIIGGGAAGFFAAIQCKQKNPNIAVTIFEKSSQFLHKVRISGGGRCNVSHSCFEPRLLVENYPRGQKELLGPFHQFQPQDMVDWLQKQGIELKTEADGRIFPDSDSSQTIIDCFLTLADKYKIELSSNTTIRGVYAVENGFRIKTDRQELFFSNVLFATGSGRKAWQWLAEMGHTIIEPVASIFTFKTDLSFLHQLSGITIADAEIRVIGEKFHTRGAVLLTHWGLSGPAVLRLSAFAARHFFEQDYRVALQIKWLPDLNRDLYRHFIEERSRTQGKKKIYSDNFTVLPNRFYQVLLHQADITETCRWSEFGKKKQNKLYSLLTDFQFTTTGKATNKEEFVTAGGVSRRQIDFKTMQSKKVAGLYFAGEVIDIDGITGGFNFQNAWTTGYIAGRSV